LNSLAQPTIESLSEENRILREENKKLREQIAELMAEVKALKAEVQELKTRKNSSNSHLAPASDLGRSGKNKSLREKSGKKSGGQVGHEGKTLEFSDKVDHKVNHIPAHCECCGKDLSDIEPVAGEKRQVFDMPPIELECTEHQVFDKRCSCGHVTTPSFPAHVSSSVQYGPHISATVAYLHARQYLPFKRLQELLSDILGAPISEGGIAGLLKKMVRKCKPVYSLIKEKIEQAAVVGSDETGGKLNGKKTWFWVWQNQYLTFIVHSPGRGYDTIAANFPNGLPKAVITHDRWPCHFRCPAAGHQICLAHLLRDLNFLDDCFDSPWPSKFKKLLYEALKLDQKRPEFSSNRFQLKVQRLEEQLNELLTASLQSADKKIISFQKKLHKIQSYILPFLRHPEVPPDNNGSERAIRNLKVKLKVSGQFKSGEAAEGFAILRSVIDTAIKLDYNVLQLLSNIATIGTE
jgi:transposase